MSTAEVTSLANAMLDLNANSGLTVELVDRKFRHRDPIPNGNMVVTSAHNRDLRNPPNWDRLRQTWSDITAITNATLKEHNLPTISSRGGLNNDNDATLIYEVPREYRPNLVLADTPIERAVDDIAEMHNATNVHIVILNGERVVAEFHHDNKDGDYLDNELVEDLIREMRNILSKHGLTYFTLDEDPTVDNRAIGHVFFQDGVTLTFVRR